MKTSCSSAEKVASIDDVVIEILLYLPPSSLLGFKSVSKHWLSLITSPRFSRLHISRRIQPYGLFIHISHRLPPQPPGHEAHPQYLYIRLNSTTEEPPSRTITFSGPNGPDGISILQSCNGLLFCDSYSCNGMIGTCRYYICNPTTRKFTPIPIPPRRFTGELPQLNENLVDMLAHCTTLAFDPYISPHYKLVFVHRLGGYISKGNEIYQILIYSSETRCWKSVCGDQLLTNTYKTNFWNGVYINGAVHWMSYSRTSIYLKIDEERLETMPMPLKPYNSRYVYFGESGGRLHLIQRRDNDNDVVGPVFNVYEIEKDCSKWCRRFKVEVGEADCIEIMGIFRGEREEDSFLVLNILKDGFFEFMKYRFADKSLKMLFEIEDVGGRGTSSVPMTNLPIHVHHVIINAHISISNVYQRSIAFEFVQSLAFV